MTSLSQAVEAIRQSGAMDLAQRSTQNDLHTLQSMPSRPRFRLKRRTAPILAPPTEHFLASVAAADVPIPSIEEPEPEPERKSFSSTGTRQRLTSPPLIQLALPTESVPGSNLRGKAWSPPRTPAPGAALSLSPKRYPDWSFGASFSSSDSSSDYGSSRPSTARSTQTSASLFSRCSVLADDRQFLAPSDKDRNLARDLKFDTDYGLENSTTHGLTTENPAEPFPSLAVDTVCIAPGDDTTARAASASSLSPSSSSTARPSVDPNQRRARWTKAMSHHLWSTYLLYLQDPRVTPFRSGRNCIPPHGVCVRVAREAGRSWKGARPPVPHQSRTPNDDASESSTPTANDAATYIRWPHTGAATRAHLNDMCRTSARATSSTPSAAQDMMFSQSPPPAPAPFGYRAGLRRGRTPRSALHLSDSGFSRDMIMSLALSTSESLQPDGPLARLTSSARSQHHPLPSLSQHEPAREPINSQQYHDHADAHAHNYTHIHSPSTSNPSYHVDGYHQSSVLSGSALTPIQPLDLTVPAPVPFALPSQLLFPAQEAVPVADALPTRRLGSPFMARSYGPSSSHTLDSTFALMGTDFGRQTHTIGPPSRSLRSPVHLTRSRSNTQKRRSRPPPPEYRRSKRPSLSSDFWTEPVADPTVAPSTPQSAVPMVSANAPPPPMPVFCPRTLSFPAVDDPLVTFMCPSQSQAQSAARPLRASRRFRPRALTSIIPNYAFPPSSSSSSSAMPDHPPRLGSPFTGSSSSFSVPNRFSTPIDTAVPGGLGLRTTMTATGSTAAAAAAAAAVSGAENSPAQHRLASRLAYVDVRLREIWQKNHQPHRRSQSPF